jgi:tetratricopeptide (TPR) repeat protein
MSDMARMSFAVLSAAAMGLFATGSHAYGFEPTPAEFASWPIYCQARYVSTNIGRISQYSGIIDQQVQAAAESSIGPRTFLHVHHYCAGLIHLQRARVEPDPQRRRFELNQAREEILYSLRSDPGTGPLHSTMVVNLAIVERERGDLASARQYLEEAKNENPSDPKPYIGLAIILRSEKQLREARNVLESGLEAVGDEALEMHYNLGLVCLELEDYECSLKHAQVAYAGGYPFPGLRNRLVEVGRWRESPGAPPAE